ncbi:Phosphatidic acid phosphatase type 2/haloperoxidase [Cinara cedri]|uniref:Phosphatidic acid phosphatase type 2/haloperoxidase n=1 Tax=Cinara cedri TaxID=506608 RepID=A0A5E4MFA6_9HEMI|nr:Phosphatidic acid phosphatase type 2/haloperoxidase [Cinara cedri]
MSQKRSVPSPIKSILDIDVKLTSALCNIVSRFLPIRRFSTYYKGLEYSCHGILWFAGWMAFIWCAWSQPLFQMQINFLIGLLIDIFAVAIIKAFVRRRRPVGNKNDQWITVGPDVYSFPSGHVSRAFFIVFYFFKLYPLNEFMILILSIWAIAVAFSRIFLRRHHLLDVIAGSILGYLVTLGTSVIWIDESTAENIVSYISDEKVEGGEYHV